MVVSDIISEYNDSCSASTSSVEARQQITTSNVLLQAELENLREEMKDMKSKEQYQREVYSVMALRDEVICMETGLPNKQIFFIVVNYVKRFSAEIRYFYGWKVERILLEDQIFITLMKLRQNYTNLHLAELFHCSTATISNVILTFVHDCYSNYFMKTA